MSLESDGAQFAAETGLPFHYVVILHEGSAGSPPTATHASGYAQQIGATYPVIADPSLQIVAATPWNGASIPYKCAIAPDMTILTCWQGHGANTQGYDAIKAHAGL